CFVKNRSALGVGYHQPEDAEIGIQHFLKKIVTPHDNQLRQSSRQHGVKHVEIDCLHPEDSAVPVTLVVGLAHEQPHHQGCYAPHRHQYSFLKGEDQSVHKILKTIHAIQNFLTRLMSLLQVCNADNRFPG